MRQRKHTMYFVVIVALISIIGNIFQFQANSELKNNYSELKNDYSDIVNQKNTISHSLNDKRKEINQLEDEIWEIESDLIDVQGSLDWYQRNFGLKTNPYGNCAYHKLNCYHLGDYVYFDTIQELEQRGCWPCSDCYS